MKKLLGKIKINRNYFLFGLLILAVAVILLPENANALTLSEAGNAMVNTGKLVAASPILIALGVIASLAIVVFGALDMMVISFLVNIVQYNNFINEPSIVDAWVIVRDLCNMFFILILLVVAFATILRIESYQWKKILPKLLIMAVLINFSRTICGLIIDASQVIMMTFINAFGGGGEFINMTQMAKYFNGVTWSGFTTPDWSVLNVVAGLLIGIMFLVISGIVLVVAMSVFLMRIIMLWIYIVLSPLAFLAAAFPAGQKYASQWWSEFTKYIINGPVLAFFIWMALITSRQGVVFFSNIPKQCFGNSQIMCTETFMPFILSIGMLLGGLMITQQIGGVGASIASKGLDWAKKSPLAGLAVGGWMARKVKGGTISRLFAEQQFDEDGKPIGWQGRAGTGKIGGQIASALYGLETRPTKWVEGIKKTLEKTTQEDEVQGTVASSEGFRSGGISGLIKGLGVSQDMSEALISPGGPFWYKGFSRLGNLALGSEARREKALKEIDEKKKNRGYSQKEIDAKEKKINDTEEEAELAHQSFDLDGEKELRELLNVQKQELVLMKNGLKSDDEIKRTDKEIELSKARLRKMMPVQTYYADRDRQGIIEEARKKLGGIDNEEQLQDMFHNAIANHDKFAAAAVILQSAKVGHLNEMIQSQKSEETIKDSKGNTITTKGEFFTQGQNGFNQLINQVLVKKLGMSQQQALQIQSDASSLAKSVGQFNLAESIGSESGMLRQRTEEEQQTRARGEFRKQDPERSLRDRNRLAWGDEEQFVDEKGKIQRKFKLNRLGLDNFIEWADGIEQEITRGRFNKNAAQNIASDADTLMKYVEELSKNGIKSFKATSVDKDGKITERVISYEELAKRLIKYGNNVREIQSAEESGGKVTEIKNQVLGKKT